MEDIKRVYTLFFDENRSCQFLTEYQNEFMFHEMTPTEAAAGDAPQEMETAA